MLSFLFLNDHVHALPNPMPGRDGSSFSVVKVEGSVLFEVSNLDPDEQQTNRVYHNWLCSTRFVAITLLKNRSNKSTWTTFTRE
jgi:hypothetical protein